MSVYKTPKEVLADIAGWEDAAVEELSGGLTNRTWRVTSVDRVAILKIDSDPREAPFNSRCNEAYIQNAAAKAGLASNVILADSGIFLCDYIDGTVWDRNCLHKQGNLELIAAALKRLHALPLGGRCFDAEVAAKRYVESSVGLDQSVIDMCTAIVASMKRPQNLCCCHNDLVAENLVTTPDLMFLDWEYACDNDPFFDLATIVEHHQLSDAQVSRLLHAYSDGDGQRWRAHLDKQRFLYLALLCLWTASRADSDAAELQVIADRVITSCS